MKKAWAANDGTWLREVLLVDVVGRLESVTEPPNPQVPPALSVFNDPGEPIPRLEGTALVDGLVCDERADPGRYGLVDVEVPGLASDQALRCTSLAHHRTQCPSFGKI